VLTGPRNWWRSIVWLTLRRYQRVDGYAVNSSAAIRILANSNQMAADWWRENAPHACVRGYLFVFPAECCEELT